MNAVILSEGCMVAVILFMWCMDAVLLSVGFMLSLLFTDDVIFFIDADEDLKHRLFTTGLRTFLSLCCCLLQTSQPYIVQ